MVTDRKFGNEGDEAGDGNACHVTARGFETSTLSILPEKSSRTSIARNKSEFSLPRARLCLGSSRTFSSGLLLIVSSYRSSRTAVFLLVPALLNSCKAKGGEFNIN